LEFIYFNAEQLTRKCIQEFSSQVAKHTPKEFWDYSLENVKILKSLGISARHVPLVSPKTYVDSLIRMKTREYDIGFCGWMSKRRQVILDSLISKSYKVIICDQVWGIERDKKLAKCKVILNIHFAEDYQIFEQNRCEPWLQAGYTVVSENSLDNDSRAINVPYDMLSKTCEDAVKGLEG
jgi:hypothetical protein